jgi:SAM-dependent methyltransferase
MTWEAFETAAPRYEAWYHSPRGRCTSEAEGALLDRLLRRFPASRSALEVGCGTGHFTRWLVGRHLEAFGLDRSRAMLAEAHGAASDLPLLQADARQLPLRDHCVDLVFFITTLEFIESPERAVAEAARVARVGLILLVLNRWSVGALSRRWGRDAKGALLHDARDFSLPELCALVRRSTPRRLRPIDWSGAVFPVPFAGATAPLPFAGVLGIAVALEDDPAKRPDLHSRPIILEEKS